MLYSLITYLSFTGLSFTLTIEGALKNRNNQFVSWVTITNHSIDRICEEIVIFDNDSEEVMMYGSNVIRNSTLVLQSFESLSEFLRPIDRSKFERICLLAVPKDSKSLWNLMGKVMQVNNISAQGKFRPWKPMILALWPNILKSKDIRAVFSNTSSKLIQNLRVNSDFYFVFPTLPRNKATNKIDDNYRYKFSLWEAYSFEGQNFPVINRIKNIQGLYQKLMRRSNFKGARIVAITAEDLKSKTESDWMVLKNDKVRFTSGFSVGILKLFRDSLNFRDEHILGDWIQSYPNDTICGKTVNYLYSGQADIMIGHSVLLPFRARQLQFLQPTFFNAMKIFLQQPHASSVRDMFLAPFRSNLWASVASIWLIIMGFMFIFRMVTCRISEDDEKNTDVSYCSLRKYVNPVSAGEVLVWGVGLACQQGWYKQPNTTSMKILFTVGAFSGWILNMAYIAAIVSVLSVENIPIKNLNSFFDSELPLFVSQDSSILKRFATILNKERPELKLGPSSFLPISEGVKKVFKMPIAFLSYGHLFHFECQDQNISDKEQCDTIYTFPVTASAKPGGMIVPKNSSFVEIFNYRILQFKEKGYIKRLTNHYNLASSLICIRRFSRYREVLGIQDTFTAYVILISGYVISCIVLLFEKACCLYMLNRGRVDTEYVCVK